MLELGRLFCSGVTQRNIRFIILTGIFLLASFYMVSANAARLPLSAEEKDYIAHHPVIHSCVDPNWLPYEKITEQGEHIGIFADFMALISNQTGINIALQPTTSWVETLTFFQQGKCDIITGLNYTSVREVMMEFTAPYLRVPMVVVSRTSEPYIDDLTDLTDKTLVSVKGYRIGEAIKRDFPQIEVIFVSSIEEALTLVSQDKVYAAVGSVLGMSYNVNALKLSNLKVIGETQYQGEYRAAITKGNTTLLRIFNKAIASISADESKQIVNGWVTLLETSRFDYTRFWQLFILFSVMVAALLYRQKIVSSHNQKLQEANAAKTRFLAAASHDLRQPVHAQGLYMDVLAKSDLSASQQQLLTQIKESWQASTELLDSLLDYSRIEAGVVEVKVKAFPLQPLLNKLEKEFGQQANQKGLVYRLRDTTIAVESDPILVELILRNLLSNAIRYTEQGGVLVGCRRRGDQAVIEIWDTGIGIRDEQQQAIFQEFYQVGNDERDRHKGLGLGLSIAKGLARLLGAPLELNSREQQGSVFRLRLPIANQVTENEQDDSADLQIKPLRLKVLVIEDDKAVSMAMIQLLKIWQCECKVVESLEQALQMTENFSPDLLISDYRLPGQENGADVIAQIRQKMGRQIPAMLVTGDTAPERLREAEASGIPLLHKPVSSGQLYQLVCNINADNSGHP